MQNPPGTDDYTKEQKDFFKDYFVPDPSYTQDPKQEQSQTANPVDQWAFGEYLASKVQSMRPMSDRILVSGADTHLWSTVHPEQMFAISGSEAANWFESLYGGNISPWLEAALIRDKSKRDQAYAQLATVNEAQEAVGQAPGASAQNLGVTGISARYAASTAFLATRQDRTEDGHVVSNYDYDQVLTPREQLLLTEAVRTSVNPAGLGERALQVLTPFSSGKVSNSLVRVEPGSNQFSLDEEWAKAHPVKALAAAKLLQEYNPGSNVRIGENGVVSNVLNAAGRPIDWVSSPLALAYRYASRGFGELGEAASVGDRSLYLKQAQQIKDDIGKGLYEPDQIPGAMRDYERFLDWGTPGNINNQGETFDGVLHDTFMPETGGFGLAQTSADGIGLLPGDPGYDAWVASVGLIHNFSSLDPLGWAGAYKQAKTAAEVVRLGETGVRKTATSAGFAAAANKIDYLKDRHWAIIGSSKEGLSVAENEARHQELLRIARQFAIKQKNDVTVVSTAEGPKVMVFGMRGDEALNLARSFEQTSYHTADGLVHTNRTITPVDWALSNGKAGIRDPGVMHVATEKGPFSLTFHSDPEAVPVKFSPPRVSSNWMTQFLFSKMYRTPDELLYGDQAVEASNRIYDTIKNARSIGRAEAQAQGITDAESLLRAGEERTLGVMAQWAPNYDEQVIKALALARSPQEVHHVLISSVLGGLKDPLQFDRTINRLSVLGEELLKLDKTIEDREQLAGVIQRHLVANGWDGNSSPESIANINKLVRDPEGTVYPLKMSEVNKHVDPELWNPETSMGPGKIGKLDQADYDALKADIEQNGIQTPLEMDFDPTTGRGVMSEGFHRWMIAKELGLDEVPVKLTHAEGVDGPILREVTGGPMKWDELPDTMPTSELMKAGYPLHGAGSLGMPPPLAKGKTRLFRGEGPQSIKGGHFYSDSRDSAIRFGSKLVYVDVPTAVAKKAAQAAKEDGSVGYLLPEKYAAQAVDMPAAQKFPGDWQTPTDMKPGAHESTDSLQRKMEESGYDANHPVEVEYDPTTGEYTISNGHHRVLAASRAGIKDIPVRWVGPNKRSEFISRIDEFRAKHPSVPFLPRMRKSAIERLVDDFTKLDKQVGAEDAARYDLLAERLHLRSLVGLDEVSIPMRSLPGRDMLKQLRRYAPEASRTTTEKFFAALARYPGGVTTRDLVAVLRGREVEGREAARVAKRGEKYLEDRAKELFFRFGHVNQQMSGGRHIYMPIQEGRVVPKGQLADYIQSSLMAIRDHAKLFGLSDRDVQGLMAAYLNITNREEWFGFIKRLWQDVADKSPILDAEGRRVLRQTHDEFMSERGSGYLHGEGHDGFMRPEHTLDREIVDPATGRKLRSGMPAFSADFMGNSMRLPANEVMMEYLSATKRWTRALGRRGAIGRNSAEAIMAFRDIMNGFTYVWKSAVLMGRMPFALLSRIQGEQGFRMAALDLASWANHPLEWFKSVMAKGDYARFADSHPEFLGTLMDNYNDVQGFGKNMKVYRKGRAQLQPADGKAYWNALSSVFRRRHVSPETTKILFRDPTGVENWLRSDLSGPTGTAVLENLQSSSQGIEQGIKNMKGELELLHDGRNELKGALHIGHVVTTDGKTVEVGTKAFADYLEQQYRLGQYKPPQYINARASEYTFGEGQRLAGRFRDWAFTKFYSKPDVFLSRGPMFRQLAVKEFDRLTGLGFSAKKAKGAAEAYAAEQTAGWMYNLAARTSAQYFLRNMVPFFPAYQELANVWLRQLPARYAAGVGHLYFARRAAFALNAFKDMGFVKRDAQGNDYFTVPYLDKVYEHLTGEKGALLKFPVQSAIGMLPATPDALVPSLGPVPGTVLAQLAKHNSFAEQVANVVLRYGNEVQIGPTSINHLFHAAGVVPPWEYMTHDTQQLMMTMSVEDALRSVSLDAPPAPKREDFASQAKYVEAAQQWSEELLTRAQQRSGFHYLTRALAGMLLPVSVQISNKYSEEMSGIWRAVEAYREAMPEDEPSAASPLIEAFKNKYPDAVWYTNGKTINQGGKRDYGDFDNFIHDWRDGKVKVLTPDEFIQWNLGMTQYWVYLKDHQRPTDGMSPQEILRNGFKINEDKAYAKDEWTTYLASHPKFNDLFEEWQSARDEQPKISNTLATEKLIALKDQLVALDKLFTVNGIRDADYMKVIGKITENIDYVQNKTDDPRWQAVNWWWENVGVPSYEKLGKLYDKAFALPAPERGPVFEAIRRIQNEMKPPTHKGEKYPTPEEVSWGRKNTKEQNLRRLEWVTMPPQWLTRYERGKSGIGGGTEVDGLYSYINDGEATLRQWAADHYVSSSSNEYKAQRESLDQAEAAYAKEHGVERYLLLTKEPAFQRILMAKQYDGNKTYEAIAAQARDVWDKIAATGYSPSGSSRVAREGQVWLFTQIDQARQIDPAFDDLMSRLEVVTAASGRDRAPGYEMYFKVFFDYFGPTPSLPSSYSGGR